MKSETTTRSKQPETQGLSAHIETLPGCTIDAETLLNGILAAHANRFRRTAFRITRNMADAEECVQDGCLSALPTLLMAHNPAALLNTAIRNKALDLIRRKVDTVEIQSWDGAQDPSHETKLIVDALMAKVSPTIQAALQVIAQTDSLTAASQHLGIDLKTLRNLLAVCRKVLGVTRIGTIRLPRRVQPGWNKLNRMSTFESFGVCLSQCDSRRM
jgi:DNA-directed RNA polymerase specialized sigma24 family protein